MRRTDREITDRAVIGAFLCAEQVMRVAFYDGGEIYIVPVNYGYAQENGADCFYFHGAKAGRKYGLCLHTPKVGFEIDGEYRVITAETACAHSARFQSVIGTGTVTLLEDAAEKRRALGILMQQATGKSGWTFPAEQLDRTAVFRLTADKLSCKAK